jgi:HSP20 family protein
MFVTTYNPMSPLFNTAIAIDDDGFGDAPRKVSSNTDGSDTGSTNRTRLRPARATKRQSDRGYNVSVDMPGVSRSDVVVKVEGNCLIITGNRSIDNGDSIKSIKYVSSWTVDDNVSLSGITARCAEGVVEVFIPTVEPKSLIIKVD